MDPAVKPEIKADPADTKPGLNDVDDFEEDHDLHIPSNPQQGWLTRVPPELWQAWSEMYSTHASADGDLKIGTLRVFEHPPAGEDHKLELHLMKGIPQTEKMPQKYHLKVHNSAYNNSVVFSEKDLPGHKSQTYGRNRHNAGNSGGINKYDRFNQQPVKRINGYSSVIPKDTALCAKVLHEANLVPVEDQDYYDSLQRTLKQAMEPKVNTNIHKGMMNGMQPGLAGTANTFENFTASSRPKTKKKSAKDKTVRKTQVEMYDMLHTCFREYKYWSLKALRHRLEQPESFIKSSLENIATLVRSGDFAMQYVLNPEYAASLDIKDEDVNVEAADSGESDSGEDGDDDDMEMEDVKMGA